MTASGLRLKVHPAALGVFGIYMTGWMAYPLAVGRAQVDRLRAAGVQVTYLEIPSALGHYATTEEPWKWAETAKDFLEPRR